MEQFTRDGLVFDVVDSGPPDGPVVVLLHGFPQHNDSWNAVIDRLTDAGYRCLAPNQRGYSPGARPPRRRDYRLAELAADVGALIDASGAQRVHLVGHDWGAAVAWVVAGVMPERIATVSPVSVPHPAAFLKSLLTSRQGLASWYMGFVQLPRLPEWLLSRGNGRWTATALERSGLADAAAQRDAAAMAEPGALTGALNWYRALPLTRPRVATRRTTVPALYVWSDADIALRAKAANNTGRYVDADYRFEVLTGVSHWIPDMEPDRLSGLLLDWFDAHRID